MRDTRTVGILGGMGPLATVEFFRRLVEATPAQSDQEHLHILIDDDPSVPNRTHALLHNGQSPVPTLQAMARRLEIAGAELLAMPCNTAHAYIAEIRASVSIPVVDMIEETVSSVDCESVGVLATDGAIDTKLYQRVFGAHGIATITPKPADQEAVMGVIARIKAGCKSSSEQRGIEEIVERIRAAGGQAVIVACTELSLLSGTHMPIRWIDALDRLVQGTLRAAGVWISRNGEESE